MKVVWSAIHWALSASHVRSRKRSMSSGHAIIIPSTSVSCTDQLMSVSGASHSTLSRGLPVSRPTGDVSIRETEAHASNVLSGPVSKITNVME